MWCTVCDARCVMHGGVHDAMRDAMRDAMHDATQAMIDKADAVVRQAHGGEALKRQRGGGAQATGQLPLPPLAQAQVLPQAQEDLTPLALAQAWAPEQAWAPHGHCPCPCLHRTRTTRTRTACGLHVDCM